MINLNVLDTAPSNIVSEMSEQVPRLPYSFFIKKHFMDRGRNTEIASVENRILIQCMLDHFMDKFFKLKAAQNKYAIQYNIL